MSDKEQPKGDASQDDESQLDYFIQLLAQTIEKWETLARSSPTEIQDPAIEKDPDLVLADLRPHLARLHTLWDISIERDQPGAEKSLETEDWFRKLSEINRSWDIRSSLQNLELVPERIEEIIHYYPEFLKTCLDTPPRPFDKSEQKITTLRQKLDQELKQVHQTWNIDLHDQDSSKPGSGPQASGFKNTVKKFIAKLVGVHTDPVFQRQRDFNAHTVTLLEKMVQEMDDFQQRTTRALVELTNRQFLFNLALARFINSFLQEIILNRQKEFNSEVVQSLQKILQNIPELVLKRTELLIHRLHAELETLKQSSSSSPERT